MTAGKAFQFCVTYKRTTEFRRLCDTLRNHLANLNKCVFRILSQVHIRVMSNTAKVQRLCVGAHIRLFRLFSCSTVKESHAIVVRAQVP